MKRLCSVLCFVSAVFASSRYQADIPNGFWVRDPCSGGTWSAVGHFTANRGGPIQNKFGRDFAAAGHRWTKALCEADSDGDALTNGEELGDPFCRWSVGQQPDKNPIGHPGICEPVGDGLCTNEAFFCGCSGSACVGN